MIRVLVAVALGIFLTACSGPGDERARPPSQPPATTRADRTAATTYTLCSGGASGSVPNDGCTTYDVSGAVIRDGVPAR